MQTMILTPFFQVDSVGERKSGISELLTLLMTKLSEKTKVERISYSVLINVFLKNNNLKNDGTAQII